MDKYIPCREVGIPTIQIRERASGKKQTARMVTVYKDVVLEFLTTMLSKVFV